MRPKDFLEDFERGTGAFVVRPDWYEEYWLQPEETSRPAATRSRRLIFRLQLHLYAATISGLAAFIRSRTGEAIRSLAHLQQSPRSRSSGWRLGGDRSA